MLATLLLIVCTSASAASCQPVDPLLAPMPLITCLVKGQEFARPYLAEHPNVRLSGWTCAMGKRGRSA